MRTDMAQSRKNLRTVTCTALIMALALFLSALPASAQQGVMRIAAIVNDEVISVLDVDNRARLVILSSGIRPDQNNQRRFIQQILRDLIDEKLRLQEADRLNVRVSDREVDDEIERIAQRNNMSAGQFLNQLSSNQVDPETLKAQLKSRIAWAKLAQRQLRRQIDVSEEEVDEELERLRQNLNEPQKRVYELFLNVDSPEADAEVRQTIERYADRIRGGTEFTRMAQTFSQSQSAEQGGDLGWVTVGQLRPDLDRVLRNLGTGEMSDPIQTFSGYYLLYVADQRSGGGAPGDAQLDLVQLVLPIAREADDATRQAARDRLSTIRQSVTSCADAEAIAAQNEDVQVASAQGVRLGNLPGDLQNALATLEAGETTDPVIAPRSAILVTVCDRDALGSRLPERDAIMNRIGLERMELLARRYMRDLRREAFIDIRL